MFHFKQSISTNKTSIEPKSIEEVAGIGHRELGNSLKEYVLLFITRTPSPADCKKLSPYSQHPSHQGRGIFYKGKGWGGKSLVLN